MVRGGSIQSEADPSAPLRPPGDGSKVTYWYLRVSGAPTSVAGRLTEGVIRA